MRCLLYGGRDYKKNEYEVNYGCGFEELRGVWRRFR